MNDQTNTKRKCAARLATLLRTNPSSPHMCLQCPLRRECKEQRILDQTIFNMSFNKTRDEQKAKYSSSSIYKRYLPDLDNCRANLFQALNNEVSANMLKAYIAQQKNEKHQETEEWKDRQILLEETEKLIYDARKSF